MSVTDWYQTFLATTRGQVFAFMRRGPSTVDQLAAAVGLTDNAVRAHLQVLERDGLVRVAGNRRTPGAGAGKPARLYEVTPAAEEQLSRAYAPLLRALVDALVQREDPAALDGALRQAGRRLGRELARTAHGPQEQAVAAREILTELGGVVELEQSEGTYQLRGSGCPVSAVTAAHAAVCRAVEALLMEATGAQVRECCLRNGSPRCRFEIGPGGPSAR